MRLARGDVGAMSEEMERLKDVFAKSAEEMMAKMQDPDHLERVRQVRGRQAGSTRGTDWGQGGRVCRTHWWWWWWCRSTCPRTTTASSPTLTSRPQPTVGTTTTAQAGRQPSQQTAGSVGSWSD